MGDASEDPNEQARGRLARIGHLFLSEDRAARLLVLSPDPERPDELSAVGLARSLARLGMTSAVLEPEDSVIFFAAALPTGRAPPREPAPPAERLKEYWEGCRYPTVLLTQAGGAPVGPKANLLISVPVDEAGMRKAYLRLKLLAVNRPSVGAIILGACDRYQAEAAFDRFAAAAQRFLDIEPKSLSYLPASEGPKNEIEHHLGNIAALLLEDWRTESREGAERDLSQSSI
jgi:hypothetical protein